MVRVSLLALLLAASASPAADWKDDLSERLDCRAFGTRTHAKSQAFVLESLVGGNTQIALKRLKFKHFSQLQLYLGELQELLVIRRGARGFALAGEELVYDTVAVFQELVKDDRFLDPLKVCRCAFDQGTKTLGARAAGRAGLRLNSDEIPGWFAACIAEQFVPTMYDDRDLEDRYD